MNDLVTGYHYNIVKRAIEAIDVSKEAMSLEELASSLGMSSSHFQCVFSQWAGVSPKKYQEFLHLGYAKSLLEERSTVFETARTVGLSGSGRLHDLFIHWESITPGEYARKGEGLLIRYTWVKTIFGQTLVMATQKGVCGIAFADNEQRDCVFEDMKNRWPFATYIEDEQFMESHIEAVFSSKRSVDLHVFGAPFQIKVWEALLAIPQGEVSTYSMIAQCIKQPAAARAVGTAIGKNPIAWLIPCHRVIAASGHLGGYHWGVPVKRAMLAWEGMRREG